jgi:hypothetical protein
MKTAYPLVQEGVHQVLEESFDTRMPISTITSSRFMSSNYKRKTASDLRWELQSRDSHLGLLMKQEHLSQKAYEKTIKFSKVFNQFQKEKQSVKDYKDRWRHD